MNFDEEIRKSELRIKQLKQQKQLSQLQSKYIIISSLTTSRDSYSLDQNSYHTDYCCYVNTPALSGAKKAKYQKYISVPLNELNDPYVSLVPDDLIFTKDDAIKFANDSPKPDLLNAGITRADKFADYKYFLDN